MKILLGDFIKISESKWKPKHIQYDTENYPVPSYDDLVSVEKVEPDLVDGKYSVMNYNPLTNSIFYEYIDLPLTPEEELTQEINLLKSENESLKASQTSQDELIMSLMLGGL